VKPRLTLFAVPLLYVAIAISLCKLIRQIHPVAAVEIELSLWSMEPEVRKVLALAEELNFTVIGYSPLGRGFLAHKFKKPEDIEQDSHTAHMPRLKGQAFYDNLKLVDRIVGISFTSPVS
jgi:pyridoxine 4-dehydrogenase